MRKFVLTLAPLLCVCKSKHGWLIMTPLFFYATSMAAMMGPVTTGATAFTLNTTMITWKYKGEIKFIYPWGSIKTDLTRLIVGKTTEEFKETGHWTKAYTPDGSSVKVLEGYLTMVNKRWRRRVPHGRKYKVEGAVGYIKADSLDEAAQIAEKTYVALDKLGSLLTSLTKTVDNQSVQA